MKQNKPPIVVIKKKSASNSPEPNLPPKITKLPTRYADGLKPHITAKSSQYANSWRLK